MKLLIIFALLPLGCAASDPPYGLWHTDSVDVLTDGGESIRESIHVLLEVFPDGSAFWCSWEPESRLPSAPTLFCASVGRFRSGPDVVDLNRLIRPRPRDGYRPWTTMEGTWQIDEDGALEVTLHDSLRFEFRRKRHVALGYWTTWAEMFAEEDVCPACAPRKNDVREEGPTTP